MNKQATAATAGGAAASAPAAYSSAADAANLSQLRARFKALDRNGDGLIDRDELVTLLTQSGMDLHSASKHADSLFALSDSSADGQGAPVAGVTYASFVQEYLRMSRFRALQATQQQFAAIDTDGNGVLSESELRAALVAQLGAAAAASIDIPSLHAEMSIDGVLDLRAFWAWMRKRSESMHAQEAAAATRSTTHSTAVQQQR